MRATFILKNRANCTDNAELRRVLTLTLETNITKYFTPIRKNSLAISIALLAIRSYRLLYQKCHLSPCAEQ